jgi:hypothetical protein
VAGSLAMAVAAWRQQLGGSAAAAVTAAAWRQRRQLGRSRQLGSGSGDGGGKKQQQSTKSSGGSSDRNDVRNDLIQARMRQRLRCSRYTTFFEQSIPIWNRLSYPTYIGIQCWQKIVLIKKKYILHTYVRT